MKKSCGFAVFVAYLLEGLFSPSPDNFILHIHSGTFLLPLPDEGGKPQRRCAKIRNHEEMGSEQHRPQNRTATGRRRRVAGTMILPPSHSASQWGRFGETPRRASRSWSLSAADRLNDFPTLLIPGVSGTNTDGIHIRSSRQWYIPAAAPSETYILR